MRLGGANSDPTVEAGSNINRSKCPLPYVIAEKCCREEQVSPIQRVVAVNGGSVPQVHSFPNAPQAVERGGSVQRGLVLRVTGPGHMLLLPLCPPAVTSHGDSSAGCRPALVGEGGTLLLVMLLLSVGYTADGAVGGAFVGVLARQLLLVPVTSVLGQGATEAASQGTRRQGDWVEGFFCGSWHGDREKLLLCLAQRLGPFGSAVHLSRMEATLDHAALLLPGPGGRFHR